METCSQAGEGRRKASLEDLAPEVLLPILAQVHDLDCLYNLLKVSPVSRRVFEEFGVEILESIISGPDCPPPYEIQELIRALALLRSSSFPFDSLSEFHMEFIRGTLPSSKISPLFYRNLSIWALRDAAVPAAVLRSVIATARRISLLARSCLDSYLARVRDPSFAPKHCHDPELRYTNGYGPNNKWVPPWERVFVGEPVAIQDAGPPSWVEEMRVRRSLWFIQLIREVQLAATVGALGWESQDVEEVNGMEPGDFAMILEYDHCDEEIKTVTDYLKELEDGSREDPNARAQEEPYPYYRLPQPPANTTEKSTWTTQIPDPVSLVWEGIPYSFEYGYKHFTIDPPPEVKERSSPQFSQAYKWGQLRSSLENEPPGMAYFRGLTGCRDRSPLTGVKFDTFRRLGFAIWDRRRMQLFGLDSGLVFPFRQEQFWFFAWGSLLSAEEVAEVKAKLEEERGLWRKSIRYYAGYESGNME